MKTYYYVYLFGAISTLLIGLIIAFFAIIHKSKVELYEPSKYFQSLVPNETDIIDGLETYKFIVPLA